MNAPNGQINKQEWKKLTDHISRMKAEIGKVIVGQEDVIEQMLVALLCKGHCLIVGVPGLAKTLLVSTLGKILGLSFRRIQFTPDLMPTDITGCEILQNTGDDRRREFEFVKGPIFANLILADEINRTPPKTQSALLEAMQEKQVTVAGQTFPLVEPFMVYATQNPIEHEGTYPLPEAQLDRFFFELNIDYPEIDEERDIVLRTTGVATQGVESILTAQEVLNLQHTVREIPIPDHVLDHILRIVHATRPKSKLADEYVKNYVEWGAGPRAAQNLTLATKALALIRGNELPSVEEVAVVSRPVLRHRVIANYNATGEGVTVEDILNHILARHKDA